MSFNVYTLYELVDLALKTPEIGAVNFNILRIVLHKIIAECGLENKTAEWKPAEKIPFITGSLDEKELPDHSTLLRVKGKMDKRHGHSSEESKDRDSESPSTEKETALRGKQKEIVLQAKQKETSTRDAGLMPSGAETSEWETEESGETRELKTKKVQEKKKEVQERKKEIQEKKKEVQERKKEIQEKKKEVQERKKEIQEKKKEVQERKKEVQERKKEIQEKKIDVPKDTREVSRGLSPTGNMWFLWQLKRLTARIKSIEEELNGLEETIDELKSSKAQRSRFEDDERYEAEKVGGGLVNRDELGQVIEELGEAISSLALRQKRQEESVNLTLGDVLEEISQKAAMEDLLKSEEPVNKKLKSLALAIKKIQKLLREVIYPASCGITKCIACGRRAHLPYRSLIEEVDIQSETTRKDSELRPKSDRKKCSDLQFTNAALKRLVEEDIQHQDDTQHQDDLEEVEYKDTSIRQLEPICEASDLSRDFAPLRVYSDLMRRNTISVPARQFKEAPISVSILGNDNTQILIKRYARKR